MRDCLEWPGCKDKDGYGFVKINGKQVRAHRVSLEIKLGRKLEKGEVAMHICDNPPCINQEHLLAGTVRENNRTTREKKKSLADLLLPGWKDIYGSG